MAITKMQTTGKFRSSNATSISGTFGTAPTKNELIVVTFWGWNNPRWQPQDCTDNQGNTYNLAASAHSSAVGVAIWWTVTGTVSGSFQVTINPALISGFYGAGVATSWNSSLGVGWRPDARARATGSSTTPAPSTTGTLDTSSQLVIAAFGATANQSTITVGVVSPVLDEDAEELSFSVYVPGEANSRIVAATTAQSPSWTCSASSAWAAVVCTFAEELSA